MDTYRIDEPAGLRPVLPALRAVPEVSVEEFVDGEEFTFDSISTGGRVAYYNVCWYRPRPLEMKQLEWVSPQTDRPARPRRRAARRPASPWVMTCSRRWASAMASRTWSGTSSPTARSCSARSELASPGARLADAMNWACDIDVYRGWAETVVHGRFSQPIERKYNTAMIFKRAQGHGRIQHIEGLSRLLAEIGEHIVHIDLLPIGAPRRDWQTTVISDGLVAAPPPRPRRDDRDGRPCGHRAPAVRRLTGDQPTRVPRDQTAIGSWMASTSSSGSPRRASRSASKPGAS